MRLKDNYPVIILLVLCTWIGSAYSKHHPTNLLQCLGQEELNFHKSKKVGPFYELNQLFVNQLVELGNLKLKKKYFRQVCHHYQITPTVDFLKLFLLKGRKIFNIKENIRGQKALEAYKTSLIIELEEKIPHIFFNYLYKIQISSKNPYCLQQEIPELNYYLQRYMYLEGDIEASTLMDQKNKIRKIFKKLKNIKKIIKDCDREYKKKKKITQGPK